MCKWTLVLAFVLLFWTVVVFYFGTRNAIVLRSKLAEPTTF